MIDWVNILLSLKQFAIEHGEDPVTDAVTRFNTTEPVSLTDFIFGEELSTKMQSYGCLESSVTEGAELARHIFHNEDDSFIEVSRSCEVIDPKDDKLSSIARVLGTTPSAYLSRINRDKDPYYVYPPIDWSAVTFKLSSGAAPWWKENIKKSRTITDNNLDLATLLSMRETLGKDSVRSRTGVCIEDLLTPAGRALYWDYVADTSGQTMRRICVES